MSPGIALSIRVSPFVAQVRGKPTRHQVLAALALARNCGILVRQGADCGVELNGGAGTWGARSAQRGPVGVNVVGAVLLGFQPTAVLDEDPDAVAARALGVQLAYVEGLIDGWSHETHSAFWLAADLNRKQYLDGYFAGCEALCLSTLICMCGTRRFRGEAHCPGCDR